MKYRVLIILLLSLSFSMTARAESKLVYTPYGDQNVIFDFYFDDPEDIGPALFWIRSWLNPLLKPPYSMAPEFMNVVVMIHGTELVTLAKKNEKKYQTIVDRIRYYQGFGFHFKVCEIAAGDFNYKIGDFQDFVEVVPSAMSELVYWQRQGYGLITPRILSKKHTNEEIR